MPPCEIYMRLDLFDELPDDGERSWRILEFIRSLRAHPYTPGDYTDKDGSLREREIKIVADYAVTYWFDAPVNIVMIVAIRAAD